MADFYQTGAVATFHKFGQLDLERLETSLAAQSVKNPVALVLPSLYAEIERPALARIVVELAGASYLREIVVTLGPASRQEFQNVKRFFSSLPQKVTILWNHGPRIEPIFLEIQKSNINIGEAGKGRQVWMAFGYLLSKPEIRAAVLHDCDILTYRRDLLARLCYPVVHGNLGYDFAKGYYARVTDRMHGRVTRLLLTPMIRALERIVGYHPLLIFFDSFRYPLAGEFAISTDLARIIRIPGDWGLEVGVLAEVYRNTAFRRICQVDIADAYDHKHQELSPDDAERGLHRMAIDICKSVFRTLASEGIVFSEGLFKTLVATYVRTAQDMLKRYEDDAAINGVFFDRHQESLAVETFIGGIRKAAAIIMEDPLGAPRISSWERVEAAMPDILGRIHAAVGEDNA